MSPEYKAEIERQLKELRLKLLAQTHEDAGRARDEDYQDVAGPVTDLGDQASADLIADLASAEVERDVRTLREIEATLARLDADSYGSCVDCGDDIGYARLLACPTALRCYPCQKVYEKTYARRGEPRL